MEENETINDFTIKDFSNSKNDNDMFPYEQLVIKVQQARGNTNLVFTYDNIIF